MNEYKIVQLELGNVSNVLKITKTFFKKKFNVSGWPDNKYTDNKDIRRSQFVAICRIFNNTSTCRSIYHRYIEKKEEKPCYNSSNTS